MTDPQPNPQPNSAETSPATGFVEANTRFPTSEFIARFIRELPSTEVGPPPFTIEALTVNLTPHLPPLQAVGPVWGVIEESLQEYLEMAMLEIAPGIWETRSEHERWFYTPSPVAIRHYPNWGFVVGNFDPDLKDWVFPPVYLSHSIVEAVRAILFAVITQRVVMDEDTLRRRLSNNGQYIDEFLAEEAAAARQTPTAPTETPITESRGG